MRLKILRLTVKILAILWHADNLFPSQLTGILNIDLNDFKKLIFYLHCSKTHFRSVVYFLRDKKYTSKNIVTVLQELQSTLQTFYVSNNITIC